MQTASNKRDYYPFGMGIVGRSYTPSSDYRFGWGGMESNNEIDVGLSDFNARINDTKLARWLSVDKHLSSYPSLSPYSFCANSPFVYADPNGMDIIIYMVRMDTWSYQPVLVIPTSSECNNDLYLDLSIPSNDVWIHKPVEPEGGWPIIAEAYSGPLDVLGIAIIANASLGFAPGSSASISVVIPLNGEDAGLVGILPPKQGDINIGFSVPSITIVAGFAITETIEDMKISSFEGKSQGITYSSGYFAFTTVNSYRDGDWCNPLTEYDYPPCGNPIVDYITQTDQCGPLLYTGAMAGITIGAIYGQDFGLNAYFSNSDEALIWDPSFENEYTLLSGDFTDGCAVSGEWSVEIVPGEVQNGDK